MPRIPGSPSWPPSRYCWWPHRCCSLSSLEELDDPLTLVLAIGASFSVLFASVWEGAIDISAAFVCFMLAVAFIGPVSAFASR